jgi:hypothetical protein
MRSITVTCLVLSGLAACSSRSSSSPSADDDVPLATAGDAVATPVDVGAPPADDAAVNAIIVELKDRQKCNRVTGCAPMNALLARGPAARGPVEATLRAAPKADAYWTVALTDALGQLGDPVAVGYLRELTRDARWEVKVMAVRSLGRLAPTLDADTRAALVQELGAMLTPLAPGADPSWAGALRFALSRLDKAREAEHRAALVALVPADESAMRQMGAPFLDVLVQLAAELRLTQALPGLRWAATSPNRFVSVHALDALGAMQDTGGVPYALSRLDDINPTVRRTAMAALRSITGAGFDTAAGWRAWAANHGLADIPRPRPALDP